LASSSRRTNSRGDVPNEMGDQLPIAQLGSRLSTIGRGGATGSHVPVSGDGTQVLGSQRFWTARGKATPHTRDDELLDGHLLWTGTTVPLGTNRSVYTRTWAVSSAPAPTTFVRCSTTSRSSVGEQGRVGKLGLGDVNNRGDGPGTMGDGLAPVNLGTGKLALQVSVGSFPLLRAAQHGEVKCWGSAPWARSASAIRRTAARAPGQMGDALPAVNLGRARRLSKWPSGEASPAPS